jgi:phosphinothricin acetyltransferase
MTNALIFREATEADLPAIVAIYNSTVASRMVTAELEPASIESRHAWFAAHDAQRPLLVACTHDGQMQGWVSLQSFNPRRGYRFTAEISVYIAEAARRRGLGRALATHIEALAPQLEVKTLVGLVFGHNAPSLALFDALGYARWGVLPRVADMDGVERDLVYVGKRLAP